MSTKDSISLLLGISFLLSCKPITEDKTAITPVSVLPTKVNSLVPDSIASYQPISGKPLTTRQFPFGPLNSPTSNLRLTKVSYNGKLWISYKYDDSNRLSERTDYYLDGIHIYNQFGYEYDTDGQIHVVAKLNKEASGSPEGSPQTNDLQLSRTISFGLGTNSVAELIKTTNTVFIDWYQKTGITQSRLGFSPTGALISEQQFDEQNRPSNYVVFRRNKAGNVSWLRMGVSPDFTGISYYSYDNNPNPYFTIGDPQLTSMRDLLSTNSTNINNVTTMESAYAWGGKDAWRYEYIYRKDGYPSQMKAYRNGVLTNSIDYSYTQY